MDSTATQTLHHYVGGQKIEANTVRYGDVYNPATGSIKARVPLASSDDVKQAIANAQQAFPEWAATPPAQRAKILFNFRDQILQNMDALAEALSSEHGKTLPDAKGSITRGLEVVEFACGIPHLLKGEHNEAVARGVDSHTIRQPLGVCAGITPFNFPAMVPLWMIPISLACGNTFVLKPSEKDPSAPLLLAELASKAGLPDGVLNVINGDKEAVDALLTDPGIAAVSFVGSTAIGEYIYQTGCAHGKRVQALCGAKNHMVVMPDADLDQTIDAIIGSVYGSAGERCMAISVVVTVGDEIGDRLIERLIPKVKALKIGPYTDAQAEMGPLVTREHLNKVRGYIDSGIEEGAELVLDGRDYKVTGHEEGFFIGGSIFDKVKPSMRIYKEEIFGPVLSLVRAQSFDEALQLCTDHEYGNGAAIFTRDGDAAREFTSRVQIGMVGVNVPIPVPVAYHSFGGWKRSLFGDMHMHGPEGVRFFTKQKTITTRWPSGVRTGAVFNFKSGSEH